METLVPKFISKKWLLCILASFLASISLRYILQTPLPPTPATPTSFHDHHLNNLYNPSSVFQPPAPAPNPTTTMAAPSPSQPNTTQELHILSSTPPPQIPIKQPPPKQEPKLNDTIIQSSRVSNNITPWKAKPAEKKRNCDIFDGKWVYDNKSYPLYKAHWCPFLSNQVTCQRNGRPDSLYEQWRWQPNGCDIPRFDGRNVLEKWRGKRVVIVGDSLNRNMWESLACLLYSSVPRKRAFLKVFRSDPQIFKALEYNCLVEFYWSPFLVELKERKDGTKILRLNAMPRSARKWQGADIMIFNTGHWWIHHGKLRAWNSVELNGQLVDDMNEHDAFKIAIRTWSRWLDRYVDPKKTTVVFRSNSPQHKRFSLQWCYNQTLPITHEPYIQLFPKPLASFVEKTIAGMRTPVKYLNITRLSEFRRDAHTGVYTVRGGKLLTQEQRLQPQEYADCSHWCLPGLPDTWNVLLFTYLMGTVDAT